MKKLVTICLMVAFIASPLAVLAEKPIPFSKLPAQAQAFIIEYFDSNSIVLVEKERGRYDKDLYEVKFNNGNKVEFNGEGLWTEINCKHSKVPDAVVPNAIMEVVQLKYPNKPIVKLEVDKRGFEAKLKGGPELHFDLNYTLIFIEED